MLSEFTNLRTECEIMFAGVRFILLSSGAIYCPIEKILIFSDLHLEKGSYFAEKGTLIPIYDTIETLQNMEKLITQYQPRKVICLGDNFHDKNAIKRMLHSDYEYLYSLCRGVEKWYWIIGNHDRGMLEDKIFSDFVTHYQYSIQNILLTHEPEVRSSPQIIGHFHPKYSSCIQNQAITGKCFLVSENYLIMPSFGAFTGGLNIHDSAFHFLGKEKSRTRYFIHKNMLWLLPTGKS